jgi:exodeoxyribonuclease III
MKIISLNANGIRSAARKGFFEWVEEIDADIICLQETRAQVIQLDSTFFPKGYYCQYIEAQKKGYSGVAIYSKKAPKKVITSFGHELSDVEGRYIQYDFDSFSVISAYLPSGSSGDERQALKYELLDAFAEHLKKLRDEGRPFVICGDWNIAHTKKDIKNWRGNQKNSGFLPEERAWMDTLFDEIGYVDAFRVLNQEEHQYTWWSNRGQAWANNTGWRIDYQVITPCLRDMVEEVSIYKSQRFSDHAPLIIDFKESAFV